MPTPSDSSSSSDSALDSGSLTLTESLSEESKIPKPPDWNPKAYTKFKKFMYYLIDEHFNMTKCASSQNHVLLKIMCDKAVNTFPDLENYSGYWPLNDMIMIHLKYTLGHARQKEAKFGVGKTVIYHTSNLRSDHIRPDPIVSISVRSTDLVRTTHLNVLTSRTLTPLDFRYTSYIALGPGLADYPS
ncbi:hypothetical protein BDR07DRAFT_1485604 [Suillus spraguei]|nr:hypothetical protein BDR07DRAFT_1485604 [Suillus spraguei]